MWRRTKGTEAARQKTLHSIVVKTNARMAPNPLFSGYKASTPRRFSG